MLSIGSPAPREARRRCWSASWLGRTPSACSCCISDVARLSRSGAWLRATTPSAAVRASLTPPAERRACSNRGGSRSSRWRSPTARIAAACSAPTKDARPEGPAF
eukprot:scaffold1554_cov108-Isochrysis_galbana.AAC.2